MSRCAGRSSWRRSTFATLPFGPSRFAAATGSISRTVRGFGTSTTTYNSVATSFTMPNPTPASCIRTATSRSAGEGSRRPDGWLWSSICPRTATPGRASTASTVPRATTPARTIAPPASRSATNDTSRPPASRIASATPSPTSALSRPPTRTPFALRAAGHRRPRSRLQLAFPGSREQHVVQDETITWRGGVERQVGRRVADLVLRVLGVVPAEVGPRAPARVAVDVLHPRRPRLLGEDDVGALQHPAHEAGREPVEVGDDLPVALHP